jgi:hypothetical protein
MRRANKLSSFSFSRFKIREKNMHCYERKNVFLFERFSSFISTKGGPYMAKLERDFQAKLIKEIKEQFPGCIVMKNDSSYIQGIPDLLVLYRDKWASLEVKKSANAAKRPNQEYYVGIMNEMSFSRFIHPDNKEEILGELRQTFEP